MATELIRKINDRNIIYSEPSGKTHICEGSDVHLGVRLLWTRCKEMDVPANGAHLQATGEDITCLQCLHVLVAESAA